VVASRAVWTARECAALARSLRRLARRVQVVPDAQAALLGALGDRPGVLVLAGTGAIVVGHDGHGRWERAGGFGPLLGDEGSAFWLGRAWLRARVRPGRFPSADRDTFTTVAGIAALAPTVLARARRGDRVARQIVREGAAHLAVQAREVARRLGLAAPVAVTWAGSVMDAAWFRGRVARAARRARLRTRWHRPAAPPVAAALRLAEGLSAGAGR
jgi:N-acetylglucosamine kinase-like BadF-type ATPase